MRNVALSLLLPLTALVASCREPITPTAATGPSVARIGSPSRALTIDGVTITTLGELNPGRGSQAIAISSAGHVTGMARKQMNFIDPGTGMLAVGWRPFFWTPAAGMRDLLDGIPGQIGGYGTAINGADQVVGRVEQLGRPRPGQLPFPGYSFFWSELTGLVQIQPPTGVNPAAVYAFAINEAGTVAGQVMTASGYQAFRWTLAGGMTILPGYPGAESHDVGDINDRGDIVGSAWSDFNNRSTPIVWWSDGRITPLAKEDGTIFSSDDGRWPARGFALNNRGEAVGSYQVGQSSRGFRWSPGPSTLDLGTIAPMAPQLVLPAGIDDDGNVVGTLLPDDGHGVPFFWSAVEGGSMQPLPTLGGTSAEVRGLNNHGQAVGSASEPVGNTVAVRWDIPFATRAPGSTPAGSNVTTTPIDPTTGTSPVTITFATVTVGGETTVTTSAQGAPPPSGFRLGNPPVYYEIATTATFTGTATVCIHYDGSRYGSNNNLRLIHQEASGSLTDVTISNDPAAAVICGRVSSFSPFFVAEQNVAPVVTRISLPAAPVAVGTPIAIEANFTDEGAKDVHTAVIDWGDGSAAASVVEANGAGAASGTHTFAVPGVYTISVHVSDDMATGERSSALDVPAYVVVYDPAAGFVTGGGWIWSPAGAYRHDAALAGKATFGFVAKYAKGANAPSGNTEFQFKAGSLTFSSTSYDWLAVAGSTAKYKGEGTINGAGRYAFMLTAVDGDLRSESGNDALRLKIWDVATGAVVYDNKFGDPEESDAATVIAGGSIVIHKQ